MKFIHCADLHLDSKIKELPTEKSKIRREEIIRTFERLCDYAKNNLVRAVIIAGDMFDTAHVTLKTRERVLGAINACENVDFIYVSGNHDDVNFISELENVPVNLKVVGEEWCYYEYDDVCVAGVMLTKVNSKTIYDTLNLNKDKINIVTMHGQVVGHKGESDVETISIPKLKEKNIDYLALGHVHGYGQGQIDLRGKYAYSGCLDGRGFDELGDKGFVLIDVENNSLTTEFVKFSSRTLHEYEFDVEKYDNWTNAVLALEGMLYSTFDKESLVKVTLVGEHKTDFYVDKESLAFRLNEHFFFAKVNDKTKLKIQQEDYDLDKSVRGEFVRQVMQSELDEEQKKSVILLGLGALKGEEF